MSARPPKNKMEPAQRRKRAEISLRPCTGCRESHHRLDGQTLVVVDGTAKGGDECDLLGACSSASARVLKRCSRGRLWACRLDDQKGEAGCGVEDSVLCGGHALIPTLWLRVGVKEQQRRD